MLYDFAESKILHCWASDIFQTGKQRTAEPAVLNLQLGQNRIVELVVRWNRWDKTAGLS